MYGIVLPPPPNTVEAASGMWRCNDVDKRTMLDGAAVGRQII